MRNMRGFNFIELIITFAVLIVLGAIAWPAYKNYVKRSHFSALVQVAVGYEDAINACYESTKKLAGCDGGRLQIPANVMKPKGPIASIVVKSGVVTLTPIGVDGMTKMDTYVLTPVVSKDKLVWTTSGGAVADGYAD